MKKAIVTIITAMMLVPSIASVWAQDNNGKDWKDRWKAEKIAFLTDAMGLTSSEAETFWPVYNKAEAEKNESFKGTIDAYRALEDAVRNGKDDNEVSQLLNKYLAAQKNGKDIDEKYSREYRKILPVKKVAELFIGEEQFRRQQIHRLNKDNRNDSK